MADGGKRRRYVASAVTEHRAANHSDTARFTSARSLETTMTEAEAGTLDTMQPNPAWDADSYEDTVETLSEDGLVFKVWGGDWCKDCRNQLPDFAAALDAAEVPDERVEHYPVEKEDDGSKTGPLVEEYDIEYIPTVVVERDGEEVARFVEDARVPIAVYLANELAE
ncbi:thioredoxin [Halogeometricum borinquense DSM 11551]|uniref:Thioredoxin n=2 Tax=Halogeometricum borinquense TaxID=60847 RepID=E4NKX9_HALBP|nr:Thioredoxin [Halogeometricum borinquense DSM 11551]ELY29679.1 thioredoxin [Halogeometricum borinquense DSM 11551]